MFSFMKSRLTGKALFFIFIACFLSSFLYATIINVPADQPIIQLGIIFAANGDTVLVQPGTYPGNVNFGGKLITVASLFLTTQDTSYISSTIIDGSSSSVVIFDSGEDSNAILCGFTITNGAGYSGGGIYCESSSPSLQNLTIAGNSTSVGGGGIYCYESSPSLENVTISGNSTDSYGGGIHCSHNSSPILENVTITGNHSFDEGGGIHFRNSNPILKNVEITDNTVSHYGGGIYLYGSNPSLQNVSITGNSASIYGGGIYFYLSSPGLENVTISDNSANAQGGGIYCESSYPILVNSILWNDSPDEIYILSGSVTATYSDIEGGWAGASNIDSDPLFVDPGIGDYHLSWANYPIQDATMSPCIDAGNPASPLDPDSTIADMGAYYFYQYLFADFIADITNGEVPLTVNFTDISTPGTGVIDEWYWDFGDGNNSNLQNSVNEYQLPGNYTVSLTVTDVNDSTDMETKIGYIAVNPPAYSGPVWHISTTGSDLWGNGSTQYPFATIQHGINTSSNTNTVLVQPGTYVENINFNGKLITVGSLFFTTQDTSYISSTIIDGNSNGSVVTFNNGEDSTTVLCGFTITNGLGGGSNPDYYGGGITCENLSNPSLENLTISGNASSVYGGGIHCENSSPNLQNVAITGNSAIYGGGICCFDNSSPSLENVTISDNFNSYDGGGIYCYYHSSPNLQNVTISGNSASAGEWGTAHGGGICCIDDSSPSLENVTITGNSASGNHVYGGGIFCYNSSPIIQNVTIASNSASGNYVYGGGIYCENSSPNLINSVLWNNLPQEIYIASGSVTATYSDIEGGYTGTGNIDSDPLFVNPDYVSDYEDYHLLSNSPCIDAGDPTSPLDPDGTIVEMGAYYFNHQYDGRIWHISTTGSDITGTGSDELPFATIQRGINASSHTDTVLVQPGTYVENINHNGKFITVASLFLTTQDTTYISSTIIDGNSNGSVVKFESGEDSTSILTGFTITNGDALYGGGIYCNSSSPNLQNVTISGNSAEFGGGIHCVSSSPNLVNVTISGNSASGTYGYGGGINSESSSINFENVTITGNSAENGGGIFCDDFNTSIKNVTITGNTASEVGGGILCFDSNPSLENLTLTGNSADLGGGIYCFNNSNPSLVNSILWDNSPEEIYISSGSVTATYSDIQGQWIGLGNINSDPLFVDSGNGDYHLQSISPCINTGDPSSPLDPDGTRADMGAYYFDKSIGFPTITAVADVPNDQGRYVIVTWQRSIWDQEYSATPIASYGLWEKYPYELDRECIVTNDINKAIEEQHTYFQREDTTWVFIVNVPAMQWEEYSALAETFFDSTTVGDYLSYFFVSAHTPNPSIYCNSSVASGYSVDNIAPDETRVYIAQNGSNIGLTWDEVEYGTFQGNSYPEINGIWYKIYAGDSPDFVCDEVHLIDTVTNLNYDYPLTGEEKKFFKIVVTDQPAAGRSINRFVKPGKTTEDFHKLRR